MAVRNYFPKFSGLRLILSVLRYLPACQNIVLTILTGEPTDDSSCRGPHIRTMVAFLRERQW